MLLYSALAKENNQRIIAPDLAGQSVRAAGKTLLSLFIITVDSTADIISRLISQTDKIVLYVYGRS